ncbi:hypothetical protein NIASO_09045 [Niabella soli DSM 19437]|uniref:Uncharacterized protein n=1 Tax=Niabella soli DSM 19437 TaxID=929713 RepID=W0F388_9BACT|nr:hypothetical protein NIASO_09045 [Niabella soli DSM 19437]
MKCNPRRADGSRFIGMRNLRANKISLNGYVVQNTRMCANGTFAFVFYFKKAPDDSFVN